MDANDYRTSDVLAAGALKAGTAAAEKQLVGLHTLLYSELPAGGPENRKLLDLVLEARRQAEKVSAEAATRYAEVANQSPLLPD